MPIERVESADDARIADYRALSEPELVRRRHQFVAEGRLVVQRLVEDRRCRVRSVLLTDAAARPLSLSLATLDPSVPVYVASSAVLEAVTGFHIHRGCLAIADRPAETALEDLLARAHLVVALEQMADADNVGVVFRNAAAFGVDGVVLSPACCDPLYRKAIRTSMAAALRVPFVRVDAWPDALERCRGAGFTIVALTPKSPSITLDAFAQTRSPRQRLVLLLGTEGAGLSDAAAGAADVRVRIPIRPEVDSLNVAVASGIALARLSDEGCL